MPRLKPEDFHVDIVNRALAKSVRFAKSVNLPYNYSDMIVVLGKQQVGIASGWCMSGTLECGLDILRKHCRIIESEEDFEFLILMPTIVMQDKLTTVLNHGNSTQETKS